MENNQYNTSEIPCKHCGRRIISSNYLLHEARCQIMSSRVKQEELHKQQSNNQTRPKKQQRKQPKRSQLKESNFQRKKIFNGPPIKQDQQRIPCSFCGYRQTLAQLDTHPKQCQFSGQNCTYCGQSFPQSLMSQHQQVCSARVPPPNLYEQQYQQNHPYHHQHQDPFEIDESSDEEQDYRLHPFANFRHFLNQRPTHNPMPMYRRIQNVNGTTIIQQSDGQGGVRRRIISNGPQEVQPQFPQIRRGNIRFGQRSRGASPFLDFFRILEQMAGGSGHMEQGLTKQQLKNLRKIKYKPSEANKEEKDLCTICYCEFQLNERIVNLKCNHMYHQECIVKWLQKNAKCPVCKAPQTNRPIHHQE